MCQLSRKITDLEDLTSILIFEGWKSIGNWQKKKNLLFIDEGKD